jgi:hypothetical protein
MNYEFDDGDVIKIISASPSLNSCYCKIRYKDPKEFKQVNFFLEAYILISNVDKKQMTMTRHYLNSNKYSLELVEDNDLIKKLDLLYKICLLKDS